MDNVSPQPIQGATPGASSSTTAPAQPQPTIARQPHDIVGALGNLLKSHTGEIVSNERISHLLLSNMETLVKQGKLTQTQILQVFPGSLTLHPSICDETRKQSCLVLYSMALVHMC